MMMAERSSEGHRTPERPTTPPPRRHLPEGLTSSPLPRARAPPKDAFNSPSVGGKENLRPQECWCAGIGASTPVKASPRLPTVQEQAPIAEEPQVAADEVSFDVRVKVHNTFIEAYEFGSPMPTRAPLSPKTVPRSFAPTHDFLGDCGLPMLPVPSSDSRRSGDRRECTPSPPSIRRSPQVPVLNLQLEKHFPAPQSMDCGMYTAMGAHSGAQYGTAAGYACDGAADHSAFLNAGAGAAPFAPMVIQMQTMPAAMQPQMQMRQQQMSMQGYASFDFGGMPMQQQFQMPMHMQHQVLPMQPDHMAAMHAMQPLQLFQEVAGAPGDGAYFHGGMGIGDSMRGGERVSISADHFPAPSLGALAREAPSAAAGGSPKAAPSPTSAAPREPSPPPRPSSPAAQQEGEPAAPAAPGGGVASSTSGGGTGPRTRRGGGGKSSAAAAEAAAKAAPAEAKTASATEGATKTTSRRHRGGRHR